MANEIRQNDIGLDFVVTIYSSSVVKDISSFTTKQIVFRKPSGSSATKTASFFTDGKDGKLHYVSVSGDIDEVGTWKLQARLYDGLNDKRTDLATFVVDDNI